MEKSVYRVYLCCIMTVRQTTRCLHVTFALFLTVRRQPQAATPGQGFEMQLRLEAQVFFPSFSLYINDYFQLDQDYGMRTTTTTKKI